VELGGLYASANAGWSSGQVVTATNFGDAFAGDPLFGGWTASRAAGAIFGVQAGSNWMPRALLLGIEGDLQVSRQRGDVTVFCPGDACNPLLAPLDAPVIASFDHRLPWFGTLRGRLGADHAVPPAMTAGVAFGGVKTGARWATRSATRSTWPSATTSLGWLDGRRRV
jgi:hypothetical protein